MSVALHMFSALLQSQRRRLTSLFESLIHPIPPESPVFQTVLLSRARKDWIVLAGTAELPSRKEREHQQADPENDEYDRRDAVNCEMNRSKSQRAARKEIKCPMHGEGNEAKNSGRIVGHNAIHYQHRADSDRNLLHRVIRERKQIRARYKERSDKVIGDTVESYWNME